MKTILLYLGTFCSIAFSGVKMEFEGTPETKVSESGVERVVQKIETKNAPQFRCVISEIEGKYYWASRKNKELVRVQGGAFITYVATDGSGFIRVIIPELKAAAAMMSKTEETFDYVETMYTGLSLLTYYGKIVPQ